MGKIKKLGFFFIIVVSFTLGGPRTHDAISGDIERTFVPLAGLLILVNGALQCQSHLELRGQSGAKVLVATEWGSLQGISPDNLSAEAGKYFYFTGDLLQRKPPPGYLKIEYGGETLVKVRAWGGQLVSLYVAVFNLKLSEARRLGSTVSLDRGKLEDMQKLDDTRLNLTLLAQSLMIDSQAEAGTGLAIRRERVNVEQSGNEVHIHIDGSFWTSIELESDPSAADAIARWEELTSDAEWLSVDPAGAWQAEIFDHLGFLKPVEAP